MYLLEAYAPDRHKKFFSWGSIIGYMHGIIEIFFKRPASYAIQGLAVAEYLSELFPRSCESLIANKLLGACILC